MPHQMVYVSSASAAFSRADLDDILAVSRRNNATDDVTGMLLFHDGAFLQLLEGPAGALRARYAKIERDPRHSGCLTLLSQPAEARLFAQWRMGYVPASELKPEQRRDVVDLRRLQRRGELCGGSSDPARILIESFLASFRDLPVGA